MQDKNIFDPEKITLIDFKIIKSQVDTPENFNIDEVVGHKINKSLRLGFKLNEKLAKVDFTVAIKTDSKGKNKGEASGNFHLIFIYEIQNLEQLAISENNKRLNLHPELTNTLSSVTYSTSRGILLTRLQGTALQNFILPVINPNKLLHNQ